MTKQQKLDQITEQIKKCRICKIGKSGLAVVGEGSVNAKIAFIGEAPGKNEAKTGRPFIGRSGKLLRNQITKIGLKENEVYVTSPVKYLPDRGTPTKTDIEHGMTHLKKQLEIIEPKIVVLLGSVATQGVLGEKIAVLSRHGQIVQKNNIKYFLTLHPAAVLRFVKYKRIFEEDFNKLRLVF